MKDKMLDVLAWFVIVVCVLVAGYGAFHYSMTLFWTYVIAVWIMILAWAILRVSVK